MFQPLFTIKYSHYINLRGFILIVLLTSTELLNAQSDYRPGYVLTNSGDTLHGLIDYRKDALMCKLCKFRDAYHTINEYSPIDIAEFRFIDGKYYVSRELNGEKVFLEYLLTGKVSIYYMHDNNGYHYFLDKEGKNLTEIPYEEEIKLIN